MMQAIEQECVISKDGRLPDTFKPFFGRKARVVVLWDDENAETALASTRRYQTLEVEERIMPTREDIHER
jgi:hypothetical protein